MISKVIIIISVLAIVTAIGLLGYYGYMKLISKKTLTSKEEANLKNIAIAGGICFGVGLVGMIGGSYLKRKGK